MVKFYLFVAKMGKILSEELIKYFNDKLRAKAVDYALLFRELKQKYRAGEVALLYNYILVNFDNFDLINHTIREINQNKYINQRYSFIFYSYNFINISKIYL